MNPVNSRGPIGGEVLSESPQEPGQLPPVSAHEYVLHYWAAPTMRTCDHDVDVERARKRSAEAMPEIRRLDKAFRDRRAAYDSVEALKVQMPETLTLDKAQKRLDEAQAALDPLLDKAIADGLEARVDLRLGEDAGIYSQLMAQRSDPHRPLRPGIAVCERCGRVFKPKQKGHAATCGFCVKRPHSETRWGAWPEEGGGSMVSSPLGAVTYHRKCKKCHGAFIAERKDQVFCNINPETGAPSEACRRAYNRNGPDPEPPTWQDQVEWQSPEQREEVERAFADAGEKEWDAKLFAMREAVITRPGPRLTWDDLENERAAQRRRASHRPARP